jgi:hypothetical protein
MYVIIFWLSEFFLSICIANVSWEIGEGVCIENLVCQALLHALSYVMFTTDLWDHYAGRPYTIDEETEAQSSYITGQGHS